VARRGFAPCRFPEWQRLGKPLCKTTRKAGLEARTGLAVRCPVSGLCLKEPSSISGDRASAQRPSRTEDTMKRPALLSARTIRRVTDTGARCVAVFGGVELSRSRAHAWGLVWRTPCPQVVICQASAPLTVGEKCPDRSGETLAKRLQGPAHPLPTRYRTRVDTGTALQAFYKRCTKVSEGHSSGAVDIPNP